MPAGRAARPRAGAGMTRKQVLLSWGRVTASAGAERRKLVLSLGRHGIALGVRSKRGSVCEAVTTVSVPAGQCLVRRPCR